MATTCLPFSSAPKVEASRRSWFGQMLKTVDKIGVFDWNDGAPPFLILDGHGSRNNLVLLLLQYINTARCNEMERLHWGAIQHIILVGWGQSRAKWVILNGTLEMQERLTHPKRKAPCCICCWKGWYFCPGVKRMGWILCPYRYKLKRCCWTRLGSIELQRVAPSGNSTDKNLKSANTASSISPSGLNLVSQSWGC